MIDHLPSQRAAFDIPRDVAYLNCAYMSPLSKAVTRAGEAGIAAKTAPWNLTPHDFFGRTEAVRALAAGIMGGSPGDYAIVPSASYGIATAANNLPLAQGQSVIVLEDQFPSNVYPWRSHAARAGARVQTITRAMARHRHGGTDWTPAIIEAINSQTAIVALPHCHWTDGSLIDLVAVSRACKGIGAALVLDLTQSAGAMPIDLAAIDADFAVIAAYKWLTGPYSIGTLYVAPRHHGGMPLEENWIGRRGSEDFARLVDYQDKYQDGARRFDMGERSSFHLMPMFEAALTQLTEWQVPAIAATLAGVTADMAKQAHEMGFSSQPTSLRAGHFLGLGRDSGLPDGLVAKLAADRIHVSVRGTSIRVTPHLYNDEEDVARFFAALAQLL